MFNSRETLDLLVESPALDSLLGEARKHASEISPAGPQNVVGSLEVFEKEAGELSNAGEDAVFALQQAIQEKQAERQVKVATALHILAVTSRLVG